MKQAFRSKLGLNHANVARLNTVNDIIEEYQAEGYRLTLRQLYYQLVSRDIVPNSTAKPVRHLTHDSRLSVGTVEMPSR